MQSSSRIFKIPEQSKLLTERLSSHKTLFDREVLHGVLSIFDEVAVKGDEGIRSLTMRHDEVELDGLILSNDYIEGCVSSLSPSLRSAIEQAIRNVQDANMAMLPKSWEKQIRPGTVIGENVVPLDSAGIWITADPLIIVHDLVNEGEHGPDSSSILVITSVNLARKVDALLWKCIEEVEEKRKQYLQNVFGSKGKGAIVIASDVGEAFDFINWFAPEHLMLVCDKETEKRALTCIHHAGEILIGEYTPFAAANYGIGITAVLPTNHFARAFSGVTSKDMVKYSTIGRLSREALQEIHPIIKEMGNYEQLPCHVKAADIRLLG